MKLEWSHPTMSPTCPPWCNCHGNTRCLEMAYCTCSSYGRLEAECLNQFWWNLVYNSKLGPKWQSRDQILKILKFKMADGRHVGKYSKCYNSPTNGPTETQLEWSHPIISPTCPPRFGCHGNGRCLATAHWTFCSSGRLEAECVNQYWWNLVRNSKLGPQWQSRSQILQFFKFKMADGRHVGKYSKYRNSPSNGPTVTQLGCSHPIMFPSCPPWCGCHGNGRCLPTAHWTFCSYRRLEAERMNQFRRNLVHNSMLGPQWHVPWSNYKIFKIQNGGRPQCWKILEIP